MEKDKIFFGESGLTSTSANHVANLAKEYYAQIEETLKNLKFVSTYVSIVGSSEMHLVDSGSTYDVFNNIPQMIKDVAEAKSLISWLREALKARTNLINEINHFNVKLYCEKMGLEYPQEPQFQEPLTEEEYWGSQNIKVRNAYYTLEDKCATLSLIHPGGSFEEARKDALKKRQNPNKVSGNGRDTTIYKYVSAIDASDVERMYFELQTKHREYQAQLNSLKFECEKAIQEATTKANAEYAEANKKYNMAMSTLLSEVTKWKQLEIAKISKLKIIIPDALKPIYDKINSLGKK